MCMWLLDDRVILSHYSYPLTIVTTSDGYIAHKLSQSFFAGVIQFCSRAGFGCATISRLGKGKFN